MKKQKPYLSFSEPGIGARSLILKKAAEKNAEAMRAKTVTEHRKAQMALTEVRMIPISFRFEPESCYGVPCEWVMRGDSRRDRMLLYIHGGSWAFGNLKTARAAAVLLSEAANCAVLSVEYRLAPEFPFPAALEDCSAVFRWLGDNGYPAGSVAVFGDSAGGNLSLSLIHLLKESGQPLPACVGLASPCPDMSENCGLARNMSDLLFTQYQGAEHNLISLYCGDNDRKAPLISPMYGELTGFPPMLIHVGQDEALYVDCDLFAQKAYQAGAEVSLKVWRGMFHDFAIVGNTLKESRLSMAEFGEFFRKHLGTGPALAPKTAAQTGRRYSITRSFKGFPEYSGEKEGEKMLPKVRRKDRQLTEEEARAILEAGEYGILATVGEDGQPYGTPLSYVVTENSIWFHCAREGRKLRDLAREPRVCFTVVGRTKPIYSGNFTTYYESVMAFGTASRVTEDEDKRRVLELICRKYLPDDMDKFEADVSASIARTDVWRISIDAVTGKAKRPD